MHYIGTPLILAQSLDELLSVMNNALPTQLPVINYTEIANSDMRLLGGDLMLVRVADHFLTYISGLLTLVFRKYPNALGEVPIKLSDVLYFGGQDAIIGAAVDEYVRGRSYNGLRQLEEDVNNKVGFRLFADRKDREYAREIIQVRNVLVHNDGLIDSRLARENPKFRDKIGETISGYNPLLMVDFLTVAVQEIDIAAQEKWSLPVGDLRVPHFCHRLGGLHRK
jgi:hypothetical protein